MKVSHLLPARDAELPEHGADAVCPDLRAVRPGVVEVAAAAEEGLQVLGRIVEDGNLSCQVYYSDYTGQGLAVILTVSNLAFQQ